jgi:outer membrane protein OmpA-like peptidoglycan-associated protein
MALVGGSTKDVRRATPKEIGDYGARRGFDAAKNPVFTLDAGGVQLLVQYDPRATRISYVGQLGVANPDSPPPAPVAVEDVMKALAELPGKPAQPIVGTVTFEYDSAKLTPQARAALGELVPKTVDRRLQVSGHADGIGSDEYNQRLSRRRAEAVRAYLVESGVAADKIELFAHGKGQPVKACPEEKKPSALRSCLAPNRRVVIEAQ